MPTRTTTSPSRKNCEHRKLEQVAAVFDGAGDFLALYWCPRCGAIAERNERLAKDAPGALRFTMPELADNDAEPTEET